MHTKTKASPKPESDPGAPGIGPILGALLRTISPLGASVRHFAAARLELLKGLQRVLDERIAQSSHPGAKAKGEKIHIL